MPLQLNVVWVATLSQIAGVRNRRAMPVEASRNRAAQVELDATQCSGHR